MPPQSTPDAQATTLFPEFDKIAGMVSTEVMGLTNTHLDFTSAQWGWSHWSIRHQVSHIASLHFRWLLLRWIDHNLAAGLSVPEDIEDIANSPSDRRLDDSKYWELDTLLFKVQEAMELCQAILARETVASLQSRELRLDKVPPHWILFEQAHPQGIRRDPTNPEVATITLEYTFRHMYFEALTHLYNIQRMKRAQGLISVVQLPYEGYWTLPDWDRSEP